jgi:hypothetical protein
MLIELLFTAQETLSPIPNIGPYAAAVGAGHAMAEPSGENAATADAAITAYFARILLPPSNLSSKHAIHRLAEVNVNVGN